MPRKRLACFRVSNFFWNLVQASALRSRLGLSVGDVMSKVEEYRQHAANCLELADETSDQTIRWGLIDMAHAWLRLAEQAEKNSRADLFYETPPQPASPAMAESDDPAARRAQ
jgi:hypothetical protein